MKKLLTAWVILWLLASPANAQTAAYDWYSVTGFLPQWNNASIQLLVNGVPVYNGRVANDLFNYTGKVNQPKEGLLKITQNKQTLFLPLFVEPGTIKIRDEGKKLVAYGTATNDSINELQHQFDSLALLQKQLRFAAIKDFKRRLATTYIQEHPSSPISLKLLADYYYLDGTADDTLYYQLYYRLDSTIRKSYTGKKLEPEVKQRYAVANGRPAPVAELPDSAQQRFRIYQPGRLTLINFWASWCLPCRREHPALLKLYRRYKDQQFTIVGISLDTDRAAWVNAIRAEQLEWLQLSDLKGFSSTAATLYGVKVVPHNILLDANGTIIGKNLLPQELEAIVANTIGPAL